MTATKPLVLDVDGTFLKTDMLFENFWLALGQAPLTCLKSCLLNLAHPAKLKAELAKMAALRTDLLPVNMQVLDLARKSLAKGRPVVLASGSDRSLVEQLASQNGLTQPSFASDGHTNVTGERKARLLTEAYGEKNFDYAGNSGVDRAVWRISENAIIVGHMPAVERELGNQGISVTTFDGGWRQRDLLRALRPHQWVKNVLLLLPLIAAHRFELSEYYVVALAMIAFSFAASSIYIVNDLLDLEADRLHPTKKNRPFAAGKVPIAVGMVTSLVLGAVALGIAAWIGVAALGVVALYMALSLAYSLKLKRMRWVDIATLASLYTLRVVAGALAAQVAASGYLIAFIFPMFITLGCVKRLTELTLAKSDERLPGRGYGRPDRSDLLNVAGLGAFGTLLAFFLYSFTTPAQVFYPNTWQLWLAMVPIGAWLVRMIVLGWRGRQDYDPIVFAMRDKPGIALIIATLALMLWST